MREVGDAYDKYRYKNTKIASRIPYIGVVSWYTTTGNIKLSFISLIAASRLYTDYKQLEQSPDTSANKTPLVRTDL